MYGKDFRESVYINSLPKSFDWKNGSALCANVMSATDCEEATECLKEILKNPEKRIAEYSEIFNR